MGKHQKNCIIFKQVHNNIFRLAKSQRLEKRRREEEVAAAAAAEVR
jgi:hypothetical protein